MPPSGVLLNKNQLYGRANVEKVNATCPCGIGPRFLRLTLFRQIRSIPRYIIPFSPNAIVDVLRSRRLRRCHETTWGNISETILELATLRPEMASQLTYFRSAAKRLNVFILGHVRVAIAR